MLLGKPNFVEYNLPEAECRHYVVTLVQSNEEVVVSTGVLIVLLSNLPALVIQ